MYNRFEWKKTETRTMKDLIEKFPVQNLIGKKITRLNAIGFGRIMPWNIKQPAPHKFYCQIEVNEPFVFGFEDGSTFEIQFIEDDFCFFSENQLSAFDGEGINHQEVDANILFKEILNSRINQIFFREEIIFVMDNGYGLKMSNLLSNFGLIKLEKNKRPVEKLESEMMASNKNVNQIEIEEGHNTSSFFWIEPATELDTYSKGEYGVDYAYEAKISIDDTYIVDYMRYYLIKYFDSSLYHVCRNPDYGTPEFDWNLEPNLYEYKTVQKMISEIRKNCSLLKNDFENPELDELKENLRTYSPRIDPDNSKSIQFIRENLQMIIDFYQRLCIQLELMMKYYPDYKCIDFMGP